MAAEVTKAGPHPDKVLEATYGWNWAADVLKECGASVHFAHPLGDDWDHRRVKYDLLTELLQPAAQLSA